MKRNRDTRQVVLSLICILIIVITVHTTDTARNSTASNNKPETPIAITLVGHFDSSSEHYTADACIISCIDDRFTALLNSFAFCRSYKNVDWIKVAGGARDLLRTTSYNNHIADYLTGQVLKSIKLHHTKQIMLIEHVDCGACGGNKDPLFYAKDLRKIRLQLQEFLKNNGIKTPVTTYLTKFDGIYEVK